MMINVISHVLRHLIISKAIVGVFVYGYIDMPNYFICRFNIRKRFTRSIQLGQASLQSSDPHNREKYLKQNDAFRMDNS